MDIQKEREAFERLPLAELAIKSEYVYYNEETNSYWPNEDFCPSDAPETMNFAWEAWQAAKAQAVPEGFVLVKKVHPDAIVHNQGLGLFKECQIIYGWDGKSKDFKDALNKGFYHGVKLGAKAVLETAMIEAQEPAND